MSGPRMLTDTGFHRWRRAQRLMDANEVVVHVEQSHGVHVVLYLFRECVGQSGKSAHIHSHREILALNIAGADMLEVGSADYRNFVYAKTSRGAVPLFSFRIVAINLEKLSVIDFVVWAECIYYSAQIHSVSIRSQLNS